MKHLKKGRKFGRERKQRQALLKMVLGELLLRGKILTTAAKAKEIKTHADKVLGKINEAFAAGEKPNLSQLRMIKSSLPSKLGIKRFAEIFEMTKTRKSGFTRVTKISVRRSDGADMAAVEIIK